MRRTASEVFIKKFGKVTIVINTDLIRYVDDFKVTFFKHTGSLLHPVKVKVIERSAASDPLEHSDKMIFADIDAECKIFDCDPLSEVICNVFENLFKPLHIKARSYKIVFYHFIRIKKLKKNIKKIGFDPELEPGRLVEKKAADRPQTPDHSDTPGFLFADDSHQPETFVAKMLEVFSMAFVRRVGVDEREVEYDRLEKKRFASDRFGCMDDVRRNHDRLACVHHHLSLVEPEAHRPSIDDEELHLIVPVDLEKLF